MPAARSPGAPGVLAGANAGAGRAISGRAQDALAVAAGERRSDAPFGAELGSVPDLPGSDAAPARLLVVTPGLTLVLMSVLMSAVRRSPGRGGALNPATIGARPVPPLPVAPAGRIGAPGAKLLANPARLLGVAPAADAGPALGRRATLIRSGIATEASRRTGPALPDAGSAQPGAQVRVWACCGLGNAAAGVAAGAAAVALRCTMAAGEVVAVDARAGETLAER